MRESSRLVRQFLHSSSVDFRIFCPHLYISIVPKGDKIRKYIHLQGHEVDFDVLVVPVQQATDFSLGVIHCRSKICIWYIICNLNFTPEGHTYVISISLDGKIYFILI